MTSSERPARLSPSTRLGPYEIVASLGRGGMGEVYRARDTRLERDVALKLLTPALAADEQFRARFDREAKSISSLNHPNICTLHDVGRETVGSDVLHFLVLELIEGESLDDRLKKGPLSLADALTYGRQIASALDTAHRHGIVHRDLKPGNVMITKSGAKLLDFGLAKSGERGPLGALSSLETMDKPLTEQGTILGTFQYMAPEQLEGVAADARTDIFALGVLLYEMTTGRKAFEGKTRTSLIAAIVSSQPPAISSVQEMSPPALDHIVSKCLEKDPEDRWQNARDVMAELDWVAKGGSRAGIPAVVAGRRRVREKAAWIAAGVLGLVAIGFAVAWARRAPAPLPAVRFTIPNPETVIAVGPPAVSPDGRFVAFDVAEVSGVRRVFLRAMDELEARPLQGSEGVLRPFWSPDSRFVAFFAGGKLKKAPVAGGPAQIVCDSPTGADGSWGESGVILFDGTNPDNQIWRVDATGGVTSVEVSPEKNGGAGAGWPEFLPGGRRYLYLSTTAGESTVMVRELDAAEGRPLFATDSRVLYAEPGYLLYVREGTLVAQPFDAGSAQVRGEPIPIGEGLGVNSVGGASFSVSKNAVLAFRSGETQNRRLMWFDRNGRETAALPDPGQYIDTWLSPDGRRLAFDVSETGNKGDIWIRDLERGVTSRFTFAPEREFAPVWSPDGRQIVFSKQLKTWDLFVKSAAGTGEPEPLLPPGDDRWVTDWSKDGSWIVFTNRSSKTGADLWALRMSGDRKPVPLVQTNFSEHAGALSPDAKYLAYRSNESGRSEVYVQEFPEARSKWQVSTDGGTDPFWKGDGSEIFYRSPGGQMMAVPVTAVGGNFSSGTPKPLFQARFAPIASRGLYRVTPDGQRFLVVTPLGRDALPQSTVVLNWTSALR